MRTRPFTVALHTALCGRLFFKPVKGIWILTCSAHCFARAATPSQYQTRRCLETLTLVAAVHRTHEHISSDSLAWVACRGGKALPLHGTGGGGIP